MDNTFFLVMLVCLYPVLWILLGVFIASAKWKKGILMGVSLSEEEGRDPEVLALARRCRRSLRYGAWRSLYGVAGFSRRR